jgi:hypothetical protein
MVTVVVLVVVYYRLPLHGTSSSSSSSSSSLRAIVRTRHPLLRAVEAFAAAISLFLLLFAAIYLLLERHGPSRSVNCSPTPTPSTSR